jgi:RND family efflux transporter MFP subunit
VDFNTAFGGGRGTGEADNEAQHEFASEKQAKAIIAEVGSMRTAPSFCTSSTLWAAIALTTIGCSLKHPDPVEAPPESVEVARPEARKVSDYQVFTARTQAVDSVDVKARVTGYLEKLDFKDGDDVKKGQVLFTIDDRTYKAAVDKAKADLEVASAALVKNQAFYDIGLSVQKQDKSAISEQEIERRKGSRDESVGNVKQAQASLDLAQLNFNWCKVTAPIDGRINQHFVDVGNLVTQDATTLTNIVSLKPIWVYFNVDQNTVDRYRRLVTEGELAPAKEKEVKMGLGSDQGFPIQGGNIDFISNQLDPNTGSIRVRAVFPNSEGTLVAGLFARVQVPMSKPHEALLVSDRAIGTDQGQRFVLVVDDKNEVEYRQVEVGQIHDGLREVFPSRTITKPGPDGKDVTEKVEVLKPTDRVIVNGLQRVRPGAKCDPKEVNMLTLLKESNSGPNGAKKPAPSPPPK